MRFEIHGPAFGAEHDELLVATDLREGVVVQVVRVGENALEMRQAASGPEIWYRLTLGLAPDVIRAVVVDLIFAEQPAPSVIPQDQLLYLWEVHREGVPFFRYVGKANQASRPRSHYRRNVRRLLTGRDYRKSDPDGFRAVHRQLARASQEGLPITLALLSNVPQSADILAAEREAQQQWEVHRYLGFDTP